MVAERQHVLHDVRDEVEESDFFLIVEAMCVPCGYMVRLK